MSKGTSIKEAISKWEAANSMKAADSTVVKLIAMNPPIEKMDSALSQLVLCEKLSLSSNNIEKIAFLTNLRNLKVHIQDLATRQVHLTAVLLFSHSD